MSNQKIVSFLWYSQLQSTTIIVKHSDTGIMSSLLTKLLPLGKLLQKSAACLNSVFKKTASNDLSTSSPVQGSLTIPERLQGIPEAQVRKNKV